jgi:prepilin-type N-terminal cleavage/methylation domain-containing protein
MNSNKPKGFTLIELIVVIAIVAVLITIVVIAINPAELLARSRDTKRVADLDALRAALDLYLAQATGTPALSARSGTANFECVGGGASTPTYFTNTTGTSTVTGFTWATSTAQGICSSLNCTAATSWFPAQIGSTPGGSAISAAPLDPTNLTGNSTSFYYAYACDVTGGSRKYELTARLESSYFQTDLDLDGTDGGNSTSTYEVGTKLDIIPSGR